MKANIGDKVRITKMDDQDKSYVGREGIVTFIDGMGMLHGTWGGLAIIPGEDEFEIIS